MKNITVELVIQPAFEPISFIGGLARITQVHKDFKPMAYVPALNLYRKLIEMGHTSLLESVDFGFIIHGASRVFLAQITRHRLASYTSGSQQYQDHSGFSYVVPPELESALDLDTYQRFMDEANKLYEYLLQRCGRDAARYVLPNACRVNALFMKANLREWHEAVIPQRACRRNTPESLRVIQLMLQAICAAGHTVLIAGSGPACLTHGRCDQGDMCCGKPYSNFEEMVYG